MHVSLLFGCGTSVTVPRCWLSCSDVLNELMDATGDRDADVHIGCVTSYTIPVLGDNLDSWRVILPTLEIVHRASSTSATCESTSNSKGAKDLLNFETAQEMLHLADKYNMRAVTELVEVFLLEQEYSTASADSGDKASIWHWLRIASRLSQSTLLQHYKKRIIEQRLVPNSTADVSGLHPNDLAELLISFMQQHAEVRYKCLGCAGRHSTEVRLCSRCSFSPHIRV